ncbi:MAG: tetratricopeptide repeat protein [Deltaproteobacteria bacterium]|nr:tetratricopeptide repeat protein [Deltaproteobacteria bacterium]
MGKKAREKGKERASSEEAAPEVELDPIVGSIRDGALVLTAFVVVALVGLWFSTDVNRVFDVPKALALKVGGGLLFAIWLLVGLGPGWPFKSLRLFVGPVLAFTTAVGLSTLFSIDPVMSLMGVYERQFGFEGQLACAGLFVTLASCLRSRRGAVLALVVVLVVGGTIGTYSALQSQGLDPFGFFKKPFNKVYGTLGNATFAGNALALIFPVSSIVGILAALKAFEPKRLAPLGVQREDAIFPYAVGFAAMLAMQLGPGALDRGKGSGGFFALALILSLLFVFGLLALGSFGPELTRNEKESAWKYDAAAAGALGAMVVGIVLGLYTTRTRGAWVGTLVALAGGLVLLPRLFSDDAERLRKMRTTGLGLLVGGALSLVLFIKFLPTHVVSATIKSIPAAFDPENKVYGQGQGTRRYLWVESPRVLFDNEKTLVRRRDDAKDMHERLGQKAELAGTGSWRDVAVFAFGIGIESYRYAFMSHKSKELEALDPMTNHDNPHNNYLYVLASCGLLGLGAYLWMLYSLLSKAWRKFVADGDRYERALAFGVVTSFFSYSVYSIAGFDSVACSVFLYTLLGAAAAFFDPSGDEKPKPLHEGLSHLVGRTIPSGIVATIALIGAFLALRAAYDGARVYRAERQFVGLHAPKTFEDKVGNIEAAIKTNPYESYYHMSLGQAHVDTGKAYQRRAVEMSSEGDTEGTQHAAKRADQAFEKAEAALYRSLEHAWAPENIFISLFSLYYAWNRVDDAERALERALQHSPHLPPVRANLAVLKLERGAYEAAIADADWVLEIDPSNHTALRSRGRAAQKLGRTEQAREDLKRAVTLTPTDRQARQWLSELETAATSTL